jgi:hypothetical protein
MDALLTKVDPLSWRHDQGIYSGMQTIGQGAASDQLMVGCLCHRLNDAPVRGTEILGRGIDVSTLKAGDIVLIWNGLIAMDVTVIVAEPAW